MIPLGLTLILAFLSFISSAFLILRIIIPILPPHPLSRRVPPSEFGLPNFRSLSPADKTHVWLACFDLVALAVFIWQVVMEFYGGPTGYGVTHDAGASARLWFAMTLRQTCLFVVVSLTLLHVRMGRSVSLGKKHWVLWAPTILLATTSTALSCVLTGAGVRSFFIGLVAYSSTMAILSTTAFGCLLGTLIIIRRNLAVLNDPQDWPPEKPMEEKPRPSFATEDIDALRDGSSWITSNASSRHDSVSGWSFSTHHTGGHSNQGSLRANIAKGSHPSIPAKSSFWFNPTTPGDRDSSVPPVPPLPSPYRNSAVTIGIADDPDPFRREVPTFTHSRKGSQSSWLTSPSASQVTLSQWSYPTTRADGTVQNASVQDLGTEFLPSAAVSHRTAPAMANAQVLGGYGYSPEKNDAERGLSSLSTTPSGTMDVSIYRAISWIVSIWVPFGLSLPYFLMVALRHNVPSQAVSILLILSITLSSPILVLNVICHSPMPIPQGLFDTYDDSLAQLRAPSPNPSFAHEYKRSGSVTVVEGRRSTDVWMTKGDAVDGNGKFSRAMSMLAPKPKLSMLPPEENFDEGEATPPLPMQLDETPVAFSQPQTPHSELSAELGKLKRASKGSSRISAGNETMAYESKIMVAQRHYSTLAQTVVVPPSPGKQTFAEHPQSLSSAVTMKRTSKVSSHLRTRSVSSSEEPRSQSISPPPAFPLPPTPPSVKAARLAQLGHKKSFSSGFSFSAIDDMNEIDALSAGVLPMLVPGLKLGNDMKVTENWDFSPPGTFIKGSKASKKAKASGTSEFGGLAGDEFESPEFKHSTPAGKGAPRPKKTHKKHHFSLPSLGLGKEGMSWAAWTAEISRALENKLGQVVGAQTPSDAQRRNTVWGGEAPPNNGTQLNVVQEEDEAPSNSQLTRGLSTRCRGLRADVPLGVDSARNSMTTLLSELQNAVDKPIPPPSAASTDTLFEPDLAGSSSGPQAQSTPQDTQKTSALSISKKHRPPMPQKTKHTNRRSSIVYIKSDSDHSPSLSSPDPTTDMTPKMSSRAVRPLMPKASKLQSQTKTESPSAGLRQLSLLQDRDNNLNGAQMSPGGTRPLLLSKQDLRDENVDPRSSAKRKNLKPLQLVRSETSKMRGILRKEEVLPAVVVRPPSTSQRHEFGYDVR